MNCIGANLIFNKAFHGTVGMDVFDEEIPYIIKGKQMLTDKHNEKIFCDIELIQERVIERMNICVVRHGLEKGYRTQLSIIYDI